MLASAPAEHYQKALETLLADDHVDSVMVIFIPPVVTDADRVAGAIAKASATRPDKPVCGIFMRSAAAPAALDAVPCYPFPEPAAIALSRVAAFGEWRRTPPGLIPAFDDLQPARARAIVNKALRRGGGWLTAMEAIDLIASAGISSPRARMATSIDAAVEAAEALGFPVALKATGETLLHKSEHHAIRLGLQDRMAVRTAASELTKALGREMDGLLVQRMVTGGIEMMVGVLNDRRFGHVVVCGTGGVLVDLLADSACRLCPVSDRDALEMVDALKGAQLLRGFRGAPVADEAALRETILRISALVDCCPEIQELDLNPVSVLERGAVALDVRVRVSTGAR
jgi:acyl-CoA synthetase (NDP forming)